MDHFAGLDVSVKDTSICIVDDTGRITREVKVASEPACLSSARGDLPERQRPAARRHKGRGQVRAMWQWARDLDRDDLLWREFC
jgi:hypothetical protein